MHEIRMGVFRERERLSGYLKERGNRTNSRTIINRKHKNFKMSEEEENSQNISLNSDVLEKIFSYLTFKDLMSAELVCKSWKQVIDTR